VKKIAIMQPYLLPYLGYFQLIHTVDQFVIYDDVQFTKKGWINRNNLQGLNGRWNFSLPIESGPVNQTILEKRIAAEYNPNKIVSRISQEYKSYFSRESQVAKLITDIFENPERNLFHFLRNSLSLTLGLLEVESDKVLVSSQVGDFRKLKGQEKVIAICRELQADIYINPKGGEKLYSQKDFEQSGVSLRFLESHVSPPSSDIYQEPPYSILHEIITTPRSELLAKLSGSFSLVSGKA
jgi:hypothetical protein